MTYTPVIALFAMAAAMALAAELGGLRPALEHSGGRVVRGLCHVSPGAAKLKDVDGFATMFLNYDLLAKRWVRYAYFYPFAEAIAGVLMVAGVGMWVSIPLALFIGTVGAVSVFKAVWRRSPGTQSAPVWGGDSNVPLGFVS